jgi:hypothetical protein
MVPSLSQLQTRWISGRFSQRLYHPGRKANPANTMRSTRVCTLARDLRELYVFLLDKILQAPDPAILGCSNRVHFSAPIRIRTPMPEKNGSRFSFGGRQGRGRESRGLQCGMVAGWNFCVPRLT